MNRRTNPIVTWAALAALIVAAAAATDARADRRAFPYTYGYMTLPKGGFEIEHYLDAKIARFDDPTTTPKEADVGVDWRHQIELEYGITDRLDFGFYNVFEQKEHGAFTYRGVKLRSRYRFGDEGAWFVDPAVYLELVLYRDQVKVEQIMILSRRLGKLEIATNLKFEQGWKLEGDKEFAFEFIPSVGVAYHLTPWLALGVEYVGKVELEEGELSHAHFAGPSISLLGNHFYWSVGVQPEFASSAGARLRFQARSLFGIML
jgi:hypothetical protein